MKADLEQPLIDKYRRLFAKEVGQLQCGDGWYDLIDTACSLVVNHESVIAEEAWRTRDGQGVLYQSFYMFPNGSQDVVYQYRAVKIQQIKESYGSLCIRFTGGDGFVRGVIRMAEVASLHTCSECGNKKAVNNTNRGRYSLCTMCIVKGGIAESEAGLTTELDLSTLAPDESDESGLEQLIETMSPEEKEQFLKRIGALKGENE